MFSVFYRDYRFGVKSENISISYKTQNLKE